jgi:hypothetical protein
MNSGFKNLFPSFSELVSPRHIYQSTSFYIIINMWLDRFDTMVLVIFKVPD